jgi:hypothetical protein
MSTGLQTAPNSTRLKETAGPRSVKEQRVVAIRPTRVIDPERKVTGSSAVFPIQLPRYDLRRGASPGV